MNIWKKEPRKSWYDYPGFNKHSEEWDKLTDKLLIKKKRINIYSRNFKHISYTGYKSKTIIFVTKNNKKKRVRYYGTHNKRAD